MLKIIPVFCSLLMFLTLSGKAQTMDTLSSKQEQIVVISALTADGNWTQLEQALQKGLDAGLTQNEIKEILSKTFPELDFSNLIDVLFVGDGTYLDFTNKFVEIRPSGTDAKTKAYAGGSDKQLLIKYADNLGNYSGELNEVYKKYIDEKYVKECKDNSFAVYSKYTSKDEDKREFKIPNYTF